MNEWMSNTTTICHSTCDNLCWSEYLIRWTKAAHFPVCNKTEYLGYQQYSFHGGKFKCFPCLVLVGRNKNVDNWCPLCHHRGSWHVETHFPFPAACGAESVYFPHCLGTVSFSVPSIHRANEFAEKMDSPCLCYSRKVTMKLCSSVGSGFPLTVLFPWVPNSG